MGEQPRGTVLVPLDGSECALGALPVAFRLAELEGATVQVVHVGAEVLPPAALLSRLGLRPSQLRGAVVLGAQGTEEQAAAAILSVAEELASRYIVLCARTAARPHHWLGRTAHGVLTGAHVPVVLVPPDRPPSPWSPGRILLPFDGTAVTAAAMWPAGALARRAGAQLVVLHVIAPGRGRAPEPGAMAGPAYLDEPLLEWSSWSREVLDRLHSLGAVPEDVPMEVRLASGDPGVEIRTHAQAEGVDLIAMAWRGRLDADRAATVKALIESAPCPVLIVRC